MSIFKIILSIGVVFCITQQIMAQRYEAEAANLSGDAVKATNTARSGGAYVQLKGGALTMPVTIDEEAYYNISINAASTGGKKINGFVINGSSVDFTLDQTSYTDITLVFSLKLKKGEHQIGIKNSWGWINIDYFEFSKVEQSERFKINKSLVTPNATPQAQKLYDFLYDNYGEKIISGVMTHRSMDEILWLQSKTGKKPALIGLDFLFCGRNYSWYNEDEPVTDARNYYNQNGIPAFAWHWRDPSRITEEFYTEKTNFDINAVFDPESENYKAMIADIDYISQFFLQLQADSVAALWRPLHEAAGGWFWWGAKGPEPCKALWQIMYDRMVNYNGVRNLIWVWTREPNDDAWYPGDEYVDLVGRDIYKDGDHSSQILEFNQMNALYGGNKMLTISECGSFPDPENLVDDEAAWSFFMPWNGDFVRDEYYNPINLWKKALTHDYVLTLDEMPDLRNYEKRKTNNVYQIGSATKVFPTQIFNKVNIIKAEAIGQMKIHNSNGQVILESFTTAPNHTINTSILPKGIYYLQVSDNEVFKIIK